MRRAAAASLFLAAATACHPAPVAAPDAQAKAGIDAGALAWPDAADVGAAAPDASVLGVDARAGDAGADAGEPGGDAAGALLVELTARRSASNALVAEATVRTSRPCTVEIEAASLRTPPSRTRRSEVGVDHEFAVVGLRSQTAYTLEAVAYEDGVEAGRSRLASVTTGALPPDLLDFEVVVHQAAKVQPGVTIFSPAAPSGSTNPRQPLVFLGVDEAGEIVWYYLTPESSRATSFARQLPDGNLFLGMANLYRVITPDGRTVWELRGGDVGIGFHHDALFLPNGSLLAMGSETRDVDVPSLGGVVPIVGDVLYEVDAQRQVAWSWRALDHLDLTRLLPVALQASAGQYQLTHGNALQYLPDEDAVLYSARNQGWVLKISRATGEVVWKLGKDGDFALLGEDPSTGSTWFYNQHTPQLLPDGTLLAYDNGNDREPAGAPRFSRAVRFRVDEAARTAELTWQYRVDSFTPILGSVELLPNGNVLACAGAPSIQVDVVPAVQIVEVTGDAAAEKVWELSLTGPHVYRATRVRSLYGP